MQSIPLSSAKPGMVLARSVTNPNSPNGAPVCGKGIPLTDLLIERLAQMGVQSVTVEGHPVAVEGESTLEEMLVKLDEKFRRLEGDSLMMRIKEIYKRRLIRSMEG
ncbi:MAG: hypothetical protein MCM46_18045 [Candidatus Manganitrophus sp. SB1]|nr:hypothetical protein [Candidatus Manganitrophus morganii]